YAIAYIFRAMTSQDKKTKELVIATRATSQLGHALARYRASAQLTQTSLAKSAGLRQATLSKVENGQGTIEIDTVYAICAALGLELVLRLRKGEEREFRPEDFS